MTEQVEELTRGEALARVAVLEAENAELRKRVCVPDGWKVERDGAPIYVKPIGGAGVWLYPDGEAHERVMWAYFDALLAAPPAPAPVERNQCDGCQAGIPVEGGMHRMGKPGGYSDMMACTAERYGSAPVERVEQEAVSYYERAHGEKSPTHGMNLGERIAHVGGRTNAAGYMEFGSVMAVSALIDHVLRDSPAPQPVPTSAHPDDQAVDRFAIAMKAKLAAARAKGRSGWDDPAVCSVEYLAELLREHLNKGNAGTFEDVANFCMMLHQRGADPTVLAPTAAQDLAGPTMLELLEKIDAVRMGDEESAHHVHGAAYWNNAVVACLDAVRKAHQSGGAK